MSLHETVDAMTIKFRLGTGDEPPALTRVPSMGGSRVTIPTKSAAEEGHGVEGVNDNNEEWGLKKREETVRMINEMVDERGGEGRK